MPTAIGQPLDRVDGPLKVTGKATYTADQNIPNLAYAVLVTSAIAKGTIASMDTRAAEREPGPVSYTHLDVYKRQPVPRTRHSPATSHQPPTTTRNASSRKCLQHASDIVRTDVEVRRNPHPTLARGGRYPGQTQPAHNISRLPARLAEAYDACPIRGRTAPKYFISFGLNSLGHQIAQPLDSPRI